MIFSKNSTFSIPHQGSIYLQSFLLCIKLLWSSGQDKNRAYLHSIYCKVQERIHGEKSHTISIKRCKCMSGWMDMAYSLRHWFYLLNHPFLFFFEIWLPLSFSLYFFGTCFFGMPSFISGMFYERDYQNKEHLLMGNGWIVVLIPNVGMSQMDGLCTYL